MSHSKTRGTGRTIGNYIGKHRTMMMCQKEEIGSRPRKGRAKDHYLEKIKEP